MLELLAFAPLSAPQLAAALHSHPRTVRRVLGRLEHDGYLTRGEDARRLYAPTMRLVALAGQVVESSGLGRRGRPYVEILHARTGAAAHLVVPSYHSVLCLVHCASDVDDGRPRLRELVPAHCTAGGQALMAWRESWRESLLGEPLQRFTDRTIVDPATLRRALERVRADGYAVEDGEYQPQVRAVSAPVLVRGEAVAALSVSGRRVDANAVVDQLVATAGQLGGELSDGER